MQLEGSRHEKVIIVLSSYVIGFLTAYIAFGMNDTHVSTTLVMVEEVPQTAAVAETETETETNLSEVQVVIDPKGLQYVRNNETRLLSVNISALDSAAEYAGMSGVHHNIYGQALSPDNRFVYFCEQTVAGADVCQPFVYDSVTDSVHRVMRADGSTDLAITTHQSAWEQNGTLVLPGFRSQSPVTPWR